MTARLRLMLGLVAALAIGTLSCAMVPVTFASPGAVKASASPTFHYTDFRSPSRNIGCYILDGTARCDINHRDWSPPPHPAWCSKEVDFGQGLTVGMSRRAQFVCAGDTALDPSGRPLPYGATDKVGAFVCGSATTGVTCTNLRTTHGFFISIQRYRIF